MLTENIFRDPVHGYIRVPKDICKHFIDTPLFQRLREIEQTGMRVLYPTARHTRFSHSLGVFHLGQQAFLAFKRNTYQDFSENKGENPTNITDTQWASLEQTFLIACLMHDCAHAPFSHTFEHNYDLAKGESSLLEMVKREAGCAKLSRDLGRGSKGPAPHEKASSLLLLRDDYRSAIKEMKADPVLAIRMIMGVSHQPASELMEKLENCLISLLNGKIIDVDKLDYIARDTWASGVNNVQIDLERLLASLTVEPENLTSVAYGKSALSVIQSVIDGRNFLYRWVFGHHKVAYHQFLLDNAMKGLAKVLHNSEDDKLGLKQIFSLKAFSEPVDIGSETQLYLPTDGDLLFLLKKHRADIPEVEELLFRQHTRFPLWKTRAEFELLFPNHDGERKELIKEAGHEHLQDVFGGDLPETSNFVSQEVPGKFIFIQPNSILIRVGNDCVSYDNPAFGSLKPQNTPSSFFYIYAPLSLKKRKDELIQALARTY